MDTNIPDAADAGEDGGESHDDGAPSAPPPLFGSTHTLQATRVRARLRQMLQRRLHEHDDAGTHAAELARFVAARGPRASLRAARAALLICDAPTVAVEHLADAQHVSRRQLERDFSQWLGISPRRLAHAVRLQAVLRRAREGAALADVAAEFDFADQAHMSRTVRRMTGSTPGDFARASRPAPAPPIAVSIG